MGELTFFTFFLFFFFTFFNPVHVIYNEYNNHNWKIFLEIQWDKTGMKPIIALEMKLFCLDWHNHIILSDCLGEI